VPAHPLIIGRVVVVSRDVDLIQERPTRHVGDSVRGGIADRVALECSQWPRLDVSKLTPRVRRDTRRHCLRSNAVDPQDLHLVRERVLLPPDLLLFVI